MKNIKKHSLKKANDKYKIAIAIGTRAELIKTFPIMRELKRQGIPYYFIHTGQHNLRDLCEKFGVKKPDVVLTKESDKESKFWSKINRSEEHTSELQSH